MKIYILPFIILIYINTFYRMAFRTNSRISLVFISGFLVSLFFENASEVVIICHSTRKLSGSLF